MKNIKCEVKGTTLTITVDLAKESGISKSGKNMIIATTGGNKPILADGKTVVMGINIYKDIEE